MATIDWLREIEVKQILCSKCGRVIGEIESDADVTFPRCGNCSNPMPEGDDIIYTISKGSNN